MAQESSSVVNSDAADENAAAAARSREARKDRAWRDLVSGQRRILVGHRDANATEREAGMILVASANRRLKELGIEVP